jgi:hypothetical protein
MVWRTAGKVGWGGGPLILFFPLRSDEATMLKERSPDAICCDLFRDILLALVHLPKEVLRMRCRLAQ